MPGAEFAASVDDDRPRLATALVATDGDRTAIWLSGEHDLASTGLLTAALAEAIAIEDRDVVVDMSFLDFMDVSTLGLLIRTREFLAVRERRLSLRNAPRCARLLLDLSELDGLLETGSTRTWSTGPQPAATALETWVTVPPTATEPASQAAEPRTSPPSPERDDPEVVFG
jgi:anti-anti-sigma factor